jgi:hypothetical protein
VAPFYPCTRVLIINAKKSLTPPPTGSPNGSNTLAPSAPGGALLRPALGSTAYVGQITTSGRSEMTALGDEVNEVAHRPNVLRPAKPNASWTRGLCRTAVDQQCRRNGPPGTGIGGCLLYRHVESRECEIARPQKPG